MTAVSSPNDMSLLNFSSNFNHSNHTPTSKTSPPQTTSLPISITPITPPSPKIFLFSVTLSSISTFRFSEWPPAPKLLSVPRRLLHQRGLESQPVFSEEEVRDTLETSASTGKFCICPSSAKKTTYCVWKSSYTVVTGLLTDEKIIREHYVRINRWPQMSVQRRADLSRVLSNHLYCYTSIPDADKEDGTGPFSTTF